MGAFYNGFVFTLVAILIFILFMLFYYFDKLEKQNQLLVDLSKAKVESTTWINTLLSRILTHFRTDLAVKYINEEVSKSLGPDFNFSLRTIGEDVKISPVSTLEEEGKPPILFITVSWEDGVSFDIEKLSNLQGKPIDKPEERIKVEIDVRKVEVTTKLHWRDENTILLNFFYPSKTDFDVTVNLFGLWKMCPTEIPIFGPFVKNMIAFALTTLEIPINIPAINKGIQEEEKIQINKSE